MNGQYIYLNATENAVWFKKRGGQFNAHCKHNVFEFPTGRSKIHPTEKNHELIKDLILDNSDEGDIIFDPCAGSLSHLLMAKENGRRYIGCELNEEVGAKAYIASAGFSVPDRGRNGVGDPALLCMDC